MMSYPVTSTSVGKYRLKSSLSSSGQPIVENGHKADENHVSNTSLSCSQLSISAGASFPTYISPVSLCYHAGIRCPHHRWREVPQSRLFSIECEYVCSKRFGTELPLSFVFCNSTERSAKGCILTNHCVDKYGSTTAPLRSECPTWCVCVSISSNIPSACKSFTIALRHSKRSIPSYCLAFSFIVPSSCITRTRSR